MASIVYWVMDFLEDQDVWVLWCLVQIKWKISFVVTLNKINGVYITFYFFIYGNKNMFSSPPVYCIMKTFSSFTDERAIFSIFLTFFLQMKVYSTGRGSQPLLSGTARGRPTGSGLQNLGWCGASLVCTITCSYIASRRTAVLAVQTSHAHDSFKENGNTCLSSLRSKFI